MTDDCFRAPFPWSALRPLSRHVSLATPFTLSRVAGRDQVAQALLACAAAFGLEETGTRLYGDQLAGAVHVARAGGPAAQVLTVSSCDQCHQP
jgi:hypothetical protein